MPDKATFPIHGEFRMGRGYGALMWYGVHRGVDILPPKPNQKGVKVYPLWKGRVSFVKHGGGTCGGQIDIDYDNGYKSRYCHLENISVSVGDMVGSKNPVGDMASTGLSTAVHLHEVLWLPNGTITDPMSIEYIYLNINEEEKPMTPEREQQYRDQVKRLHGEVRKLTGQVQEANARAERYKDNIRDGDRIIQEQSAQIADLQGRIDRMQGGTDTDQNALKLAKEAREHLDNALSELGKASEKLPN